MDPLSEIVGDSPGITALREQVRQLLRAWTGSRRPPPVLIQGETGTGKGLLAHVLHRASPRSGHPFVDLNCAAIPEALLEAELFGYERGAFTDARQSKPGLFQLADRGVVFLDEIGLLAPAMQAKLLSVLENRTARRLGAVRSEPVDVWIMAATNVELTSAIRDGAFREDLYHRLAVVTLSLPPLRDRDTDILALASGVLKRVCDDYGLPQKTLATDAIAALQVYAWPGNIRELENVMERAALLTDASVLTAAHLRLTFEGSEPEGVTSAAGAPTELQSSRVVMRQHLLNVLTQTGWNISRSAALLGLSRNTVTARIARYGLHAPLARPTGHGTAVPKPIVTAEVATVAIGSGRTSPPVPTLWEPRRLLLLLARLGVAEGGEVAAHKALNIMIEKIRSFGGRIDGQGAKTLFAVFGLDPVEDPAFFAAHSAGVIRHAARQAGVVSVTLGLHSADIAVRDDGDNPLLDSEACRRAWNALDTQMDGVPPGTIVATQAVAGLLQRRFILTPLALGSSAYSVDGLWHAQFGASRPRRSFVGRREELALLESRLSTASAGHGQIVDITGEAGMGKSRLLVELAASPRFRGVRFVEGRCLPTETSTPFFPWLQIIRSVCEVPQSAAASEIGDRVDETLAELKLDAGELTMDLKHLLDAGVSPAPSATAIVLKRRLFAAVQHLLFAYAARAPSPLVVVVEDLHWADPSSDACLHAIAESLASVPILLVTTYRPEFKPGWMGTAHALQLSLPRLSVEESHTLIREIFAERSGASPDLERSIQARADGNPLFLEELSRAATEDCEGSAPERIPATIQATLVARLDRLPPRDCRVLLAASVVGRECTLSILRSISGIEPAALPAILGRLQRADLLYATGSQAAEPEYVFKHALVQEVAYGRLSAAERRLLHLSVVDTIERLYVDRLAEQVSRLAHHAVRGEDRIRAVRYLMQAGQKSAARSALVEGLGHLDSALEWLQSWPDDAIRDRQELDLQLSRAGVLRATRGFAAPEVGDACARAMQLCHRLGDESQLLPTLNGVYSFHLMRAEYARAGAAAADLLATAQRQGNATFEMIGYRAVGGVLLHTGRLVEGRAALERALALYDPTVHGALATRYGTDHAQVTSCFLGLVLSLLGFGAEGRAKLQWAVAHSERLGHPHSIALALSYYGILLLMFREFAAVPDPGARLVDIAQRHSLTLLGLSGMFYLAAARRPRTSRSLDDMHRAAEAWWATHATGYRPFVEAVMAEAHAEAGDVVGGLKVIAEAEVHLEESDERWIEPEVHRIHGLLLAANPRRLDDAEARLSHALHVAQAQRAEMWELRAAIELARLFRNRGARARALDVLGPLLTRLSSDSETSDVVAARELHASLH